MPCDSGDRKKKKIWKEQPEGLKNVWVRSIKSNWIGAKVVLGYSFINEDGALISKTKKIEIRSRFPRSVKLRTSVA